MNEELAILYLLYLLLGASLSLENRDSHSSFLKVILRGCLWMPSHIFPAWSAPCVYPLTSSQLMLQQQLMMKWGKTAAGNQLLGQLASSWSLLLYFLDK